MNHAELLNYFILATKYNDNSKSFLFKSLKKCIYQIIEILVRSDVKKLTGN